MLAPASCSRQTSEVAEGNSTTAINSGQIADFAADFVKMAPDAVASVRTQTFTSLLQQMTGEERSSATISGDALNLRDLTIKAAANAKSLDALYPNIGVFLSKTGADLTQLNEADIRSYVLSLPKLTASSGLALDDYGNAATVDESTEQPDGSAVVDQTALNRSVGTATQVEVISPSHPKRCVASKVGIGLGTTVGLVGGGVALVTNIIKKATLTTNVVAGVVGVAGLAAAGLSGWGTYASCTGD